MQKDLSPISGWVGPTKKDMGFCGINEHNTQSALSIYLAFSGVCFLTIFFI